MVVNDQQKAEWLAKARQVNKEREARFQEMFAPKVIKTYQENGYTVTVYEPRSCNYSPNWIRPTSRKRSYENA